MIMQFPISQVASRSMLGSYLENQVSQSARSETGLVSLLNTIGIALTAIGLFMFIRHQL